MSSSGPNICQASTEDDKHSIAQIGLQLPAFMPASMTSNHTFMYLNQTIMETAKTGESLHDIQFRAPYGESQEILAINLNDPFRPIEKMWQFRGTAANPGAYTSSVGAIYRNMQGQYFAPGIMRYRSMYKYYKIKKAHWTISFTNLSGYNLETPPAAVTLHAYQQNNETVLPTLTFMGASVPPGNTATKIIPLLQNPRVSTLCGGAKLGAVGGSTYSAGLLNSAIYHNDAVPVLTTSFTYDNTKSVGSDPNIDTNIKYWTVTGTSATLPPAPANINRLHIFAIPTATGPFGSSNLGHFNPAINIKVEYEIEWRDHSPTDSEYTDIPRLS